MPSHISNWCHLQLGCMSMSLVFIQEALEIRKIQLHLLFSRIFFSSQSSHYLLPAANSILSAFFFCNPKHEHEFGFFFCISHALRFTFTVHFTPRASCFFARLYHNLHSAGYERKLACSNTHWLREKCAFYRFCKWLFPISFKLLNCLAFLSTYISREQHFFSNKNFNE